MTELWKRISRYPNYEVSSLGRVRSLDRFTTYTTRRGVTKTAFRRGKMLKLTKDCEYLVVGLYNEEGQKNFNVHRLVARTFLGKPPKGKTHVLHLDDNGYNNEVGNLEWGTVQDNNLDKQLKGRQAKGVQVAGAKLTDKKVLKIRVLFKRGVAGRQIAELYGMSESSISAIKHRKTWSHI